ncbi:MAG: hypothetical protein E7445_03515 [Ruminococcaceae bacterium]|nr:hypothetical protein [Oscillospiraceae bacterium]
MLFQNEEVSLKLEVLRYEFPADGGQYDTDDRNWLVMRGTYTEDGLIIKDTNSCLLTYELREMAASLKVVRAGIKESYQSEFAEPYFMLSAVPTGEGQFEVWVSFALPNTMEDVDVAEVDCVMQDAELAALIDELDALCEKFPDRN